MDHAVIFGYEKVVQLLVERGTCVTIKNNEGLTPLNQLRTRKEVIAREAQKIIKKILKSATQRHELGNIALQVLVEISDRQSKK